MTYAQDILQVADILATDRDATSGELRVNIGDSITGEGEWLAASMWGVDGFFGRPNNADADGACMVLYHVEGNQQRAVGTRDPRQTGAYFSMEEGDRSIVTDASPKFFIKKATNQVALYTENGGDTTKPMQVNLNGSTGIVDISTSDGSSVAQIQMKPDEINIVGGGCCINMKAGKLQLFADYIGIQAGRGNLGVIAGVVPPATSALIYGVSGIAGVPSVNWTVAP